nr:PAS domain S-box protein [candidate division Zixibacteria bacterium]
MDNLTKYRKIIESAAESIFILNRDGFIEIINPAAASRFGGLPGEFADRKLTDVLPGKNTDEFLLQVAKVFTTGKDQLVSAIPDCFRPGGDYETSLEPIRNTDGSITSVLCILRVISNSIKPESDLDSDKDFVRTLLDTANSLIVCLDEAAKIKVFNRECERITGYKSEEVIGLSWPNNFLPPSHRHQHLKDFKSWIKAHPRDVYDGPLVTKSGEIRTILWSNSCLISPKTDELTAIAVGHDITDRIRIEQALRESEARFTEALEYSRDIMYRLNLDTMEYDYISASARVITGYTSEEITRFGPEGMRRLTHPADLERLKDHRRQLITSSPESESSSTTEYRIKCHDGKYRWLSDSHALVRDSDNKPRFIIGNVRDITDQKLIEEALHKDQEELEKRVEYRTAELKTANLQLKEEIDNRKTIEMALRESEKRYELATNAGHVGVWDWNLETNEIYIDPKLKAMLGYADYEIKNHLDDWVKYVHPEDIEKVGSETERHLSGETPQFEIVYRMFHRDGSTRWILARATAVSDREGKAVRIVGTDTDITDRRLAEIELLETRQRLSHLLSSSPAVIYSCGAAPDFPTTFISDNIFESLGYNPIEFYDDPFFWSKQIHPDDYQRIMDTLKSITADGAFSYEYRFRRKDGQYVWLFDELSAMADDDGHISGLIGSWFDISARKNAERMLQKTADELRLEREILAEKNIALKQILDHIETRREEYKQAICREIEYAIRPFMRNLKRLSAGMDRREIEGLETKIQGILNKDIDVFRDRFSRLSPREMEICQLIRNGMSSKQISDHLNLAVVTIHKHREQIRKKLGITGKDINLISFLQNRWPDRHTQ